MNDLKAIEAAEASRARAKAQAAAAPKPLAYFSRGLGGAVLLHVPLVPNASRKNADATYVLEGNRALEFLTEAAGESSLVADGIIRDWVRKIGGAA